MENNSRTIIAGTIAFFTGVIVGVSAGLLMAPQSGDRTRRQIQKMASDVQEDTENLVNDAKDKVSNWVDRGKKFVANS